MINYFFHQEFFKSPIRIKDQLLSSRDCYLIGFGEKVIGEISPLPGLHPENYQEALKWTQNFFTDETIVKLGLLPNSVKKENLDWNKLFFGIFDEKIIEFQKAPSSAIFAIEMAIINLIFPANLPLKNYCFLDFNFPTPFKNGFIKIKIGRDSIEADRKKILTYINESNLIFRLDGNKLFSANKLHQLLEGIPLQRIQFLEDPFINESEMMNFYKNFGLNIKLALDESIKNIDPLLKDPIIKNILKYSVIKPNLNGGFSGTIKMANKLKQLGIKTVLSSSFETHIGIQTINKINSMHPALFIDAPGIDTLKYFK